MHPNPVFRDADAGRCLDFARARGFGTLILSAETGPLAAHLPFVIEGDGRIGMHLARSNPILRRLDTPQPALLAVTGPDGYVSPGWYGIADQVPTWNYVAVHLRGRLERRPAAALRPHLAALSAEFERRLAKPPWRMEKLDEAVLARLERMIVPVLLTIEYHDGSWKLGQNKPAAARLSAAEAMLTGTPGSEVAALVELMRGAAEG
ncbi:MAG: FMN-binding negative transcriptional regulator [Alphaproteobacteria bacterium]|nr:MAG: FMN-binding negative transcriptional regulator [Alphaproteobacteria bacterium]